MNNVQELLKIWKLTFIFQIGFMWSTSLIKKIYPLPFCLRIIDFSIYAIVYPEKNYFCFFISALILEFCPNNQSQVDQEKLLIKQTKLSSSVAVFKSEEFFFVDVETIVTKLQLQLIIQGLEIKDTYETQDLLRPLEKYKSQDTIKYLVSDMWKICQLHGSCHNVELSSFLRYVSLV